MAPPRTKYAIPEGWVMQKKVEGDGTEVEVLQILYPFHHLCKFSRFGFEFFCVFMVIIILIFSDVTVSFFMLIE